MLKSQQKVDVKLSKICQNHKKLGEWQKFASLFTETVHKYSSSEDSRKCRRRFKLSVDLLDSLDQGRTNKWILDTDVGSHKQSLGLLTLLALLCSGNCTTGSPSSLYEPHKQHNMASNYRGLYEIFYEISVEVLTTWEFYCLDGLYSNELVFVHSFVSSI